MNETPIAILCDLFGIDPEDVEQHGTELRVEQDEGPSVTIDPDRYVELSHGSFTLRSDAHGDVRDVLTRALAALEAFNGLHVEEPDFEAMDQRAYRLQRRDLKRSFNLIEKLGPLDPVAVIALGDRLAAERDAAKAQARAAAAAERALFLDAISHHPDPVSQTTESVG